MVVDTITARNNLSSNFRWEGLKVFVKDNGTGVPTNYQLQGGITNTDWVDISVQGSSSFKLELLDIIAAGKTVQIPSGGMIEKIIFKNKTAGRTAILDIGTTPGGQEIMDSYQVDYGWNILNFNNIYEIAQDIYLSGTFDSSTIDFYITYQQIL